MFQPEDRYRMVRHDGTPLTEDDLVGVSSAELNAAVGDLEANITEALNGKAAASALSAEIANRQAAVAALGAQIDALPTGAAAAPPANLAIALAAGAVLSQWVDLGHAGAQLTAVARADVAGTLAVSDAATVGGADQTLDDVAATSRGARYVASSAVVSIRRWARLRFANGPATQSVMQLDWSVR